MTTAAFSRLQLAAALLEYDNDPTNPDAPYRSAHESAIFAHLRRNTRPHPAPRKSDYLGVSIPSETGSLGGRESALDNRRSRGSIDALRNPFGPDDTLEDGDEDEHDNLEVDLASWGLDAFLPRDRESKGKGKAKSDVLPNPHPVTSLRSQQPQPTNAMPRRTMGTRSMSVGNFDNFGVGGAFLEAQSSIDNNRRRSIGSPLDLVGMEPPQVPFQRRRASVHALIESLPVTPPLHSIPFPTSSVRSASPLPNEDEGFRPSSRTSRFDPKLRPHERTYSTASRESRMLLKDDGQNQGERPRTMSHATMVTALPADDNPFALRPPSRSSRFDPKAAAHARTLSNASMGSRMLLDNDGVSVVTAQGQNNRERPYSTLELLRPKVLVMPSPLQPVTPPVAPPPVKVRDGFQLSTDGPPLPPGARSTRRSSMTLSVIEPLSSVTGPIASNSFTPNPRQNLSLSQLTFRNQLIVGGQRDVAYADMDDNIPRATEDGEQIQPELPLEAEPLPLPVQAPEVVQDPPAMGRPPGKLFGKSLIDDLENRKAQMRSKQRVFTGDQRPSMMARGQLKRSSTLIDPTSLQARPASQRMSSYGSQGSQQPLGRRNSANVKPLLNFDDDDQSPQNLSPNPKNPNSRSVFGVDTLWEREMNKLREIESQEKIEAEERRQREAEAEARETKKKGRSKGKWKGKSKATDDLQEPPMEIAEPVNEPRISAEPPVLPAIPKAIRRPPPEVRDDESDSDESDVEPPPHSHLSRNADKKSDHWFAGSSDEEDNGPRRTTGTGPRYPKSTRPADDDSEEDVPLAATVDRAVQRATQLKPSQMDSDEEKPLSILLQKTKLSLPSINFDNLSDSNKKADDDDDQPLGLRASRVVSSYSGQGGGDDDDRPLAFHPEHQRRTQYQMIAQQQQQLMMQAQMHNSMFFAPPTMMGPAFFGPPIPPPMMMQQPPIPMPSPPPMHDAGKYGRVDRWRRDVAVEGDQ